MTPHKHAKEIHAWADGAQIQFNIGAGWESYKSQDTVPAWNSIGIKFRVKPNTIRYRNFLWMPLRGTRSAVAVCSDKENNAESRESWHGFIKWLGDWQEVEV